MCGVEKSKQQDLIDHKRNAHNEGTENTPYCDSCKKSFGNKSSLTLHVKSIHQGIFIHNCTICDYKTNCKHNSSPTLKDMGPKRNKNYKKPTSVQIVRKVSSQMHCLKNTRMQTLARLHRKILNVIIAGHLGGLSATHPLLGT